MKIWVKIFLLTLVLGIAAPKSHAERWYSPNTGRWLSRDPLNTVNDEDARYELLLSKGYETEIAESISELPSDPSDYLFVKNNGISNYDLFGFVCYTRNIKGTFTRVNELKHKLSGVLGNHLTYTFCCPGCYPYLSSWTLTSKIPISSPASEPFPGGWYPIITGSSPCWTIVIEVPWRTARKTSDQILNGIRLKATCCSPKGVDALTP